MKKKKMDAAQGHVPLFTYYERRAVCFCVARRAVPVYYKCSKMLMMIPSSLDMLIFLFACCQFNNKREEDYCRAEVTVVATLLCPHEQGAQIL